jgi:hypothetical protein
MMAYLVLEHVPYEGTTVHDVDTFDDACDLIHDEVKNWKTDIAHFEIVETVRRISDVRETITQWVKENPDV